MTKHADADRATAGREKRFVALTSVAAAILLTSTKLAIGISTGSLGILSEAAHSALDFVAAAITYFAVRVSDRPADIDHPYGHEKVESLSALIETLLLLVTCAWIIKEGVARLLFKSVHVEATPWAFAVVLMSIIVDVSRSRALMRVAKRHKSQALEADALHFSTDVWSSSVVLVGLVVVWYGGITGRASSFERADALAALGVAVIVLHVSLRMGRRTVDVLLDRAPTGLAEHIGSTVRDVDGVLGCERIRLRPVGKHTFIDLAVSVARGTPLERSHAIAEAVEERIRESVSGADVVVHVEPQRAEGESVVQRVRSVAGNLGHTTHNVVVWENGNGLNLECHVEVSEGMGLAAAHDLADTLEADIRGEIPEVASVTVHVEPQEDRQGATEDVTRSSGAVVSRILEAAAGIPGILGCHNVIVISTERGLRVAMHCVFAPDLPIADVHRYSTMLEGKVQSSVPDVISVTTHAEPFGR